MHTPQYGQMDLLLDRVVIVADGKIAKIAAGSEEATVLDIWGVDAGDVRRLAVRGRPTCCPNFFLGGARATHPLCHGDRARA